MAQLHLVLVTCTSGQLGYSRCCRLWNRTVDAAFAPEKGERVVMLGSDEGPDEGAYQRVKDRYLRYDGELVIELEGCVIDPPEQWSRAGRTSWYTQCDGDLHDQLRASGWATNDRVEHHP